MGGHSKEVFLHLMTIEVQPTVKFAGKIQTTHSMIYVFLGIQCDIME